MTEIKIVPQRFTFEKPAIKNAIGDTVVPGISISIDIDTYESDRIQIKKDLASLFTEILKYFD